MFRSGSVFLLALVIGFSVPGSPAFADGAANGQSVGSATAGTSSAIPGSSGLPISAYRAALDRQRFESLAAAIVSAQPERVAVYDPGTAPELIAGYVVRPVGADDTVDPPVAIVAFAGGDGDTLWPGAAWLAVLSRFVDNPPSRGALMLLVSAIKNSAVDVHSTGAAAPDVPGTPLIRAPGIRAALADARIGAIVILDLDGPNIGARLDAESRGHQAPRQVLTLVRTAAASLGQRLAENPVGGLYAAAGLSAGNPILAPWLQAGLPAVALGSVSMAGSVVPVGEADYVLLVAAIAERSGAMPAGQGRDVDYFRYPLPSGTMTIGDGAIVALILASAVLLVIASALGPFGRKPLSAATVAWEAAIAIVLALTAIAGSQQLVAAGSAMAVHLGMRAQEAMAVAWMQPVLGGILLALRLVVVLAVFYAVSGLLSRLGLHAPHGRYEASVAALALFSIDALLAIAVVPALVPMLLLSMMLVMMAGRSAAGAMLGLFAMAGVMVPFVDPRILTGLRHGLVQVSLLAAPFGLWVVAASSSANVLRRGRSTAPVWLAIAVAAAVSEALVRIAAAL